MFDVLFTASYERFCILVKHFSLRRDGRGCLSSQGAQTVRLLEGGHFLGAEYGCDLGRTHIPQTDRCEHLEYFIHDE